MATCSVLRVQAGEASCFFSPPPSAAPQPWPIPVPSQLSGRCPFPIGAGSASADSDRRAHACRRQGRGGRKTTALTDDLSGRGACEGRRDCVWGLSGRGGSHSKSGERVGRRAGRGGEGELGVGDGGGGRDRQTEKSRHRKTEGESRTERRGEGTGRVEDAET